MATLEGDDKTNGDLYVKYMTKVWVVVRTVKVWVGGGGRVPGASCARWHKSVESTYI